MGDQYYSQDLDILDLHGTVRRPTKPGRTRKSRNRRAVVHFVDRDDSKLLSRVLRALAAKYPDDYAAPGIQFAYIGMRADEKYYCAVHRYNRHSVKDRTIVSNCTGDTVEDALCGCLDKMVTRESLKIDREILRVSEKLGG